MIGKDVDVDGLEVTFGQEPDSCDTHQEGRQELRVTVEDAGSGPYLVLRTDRWAVDDIEAFAAGLRSVLALVERRETSEEEARRG